MFFFLYQSLSRLKPQFFHLPFVSLLDMIPINTVVLHCIFSKCVWHLQTLELLAGSVSVPSIQVMQHPEAPSLKPSLWCYTPMQANKLWDCGCCCPQRAKIPAVQMRDCCFLSVCLIQVSPTMVLPWSLCSLYFMHNGCKIPCLETTFNPDLDNVGPNQSPDQVLVSTSWGITW